MSIWSKQDLERRVASLEEELQATRAIVKKMQDALQKNDTALATELAEIRTALARMEKQRQADVEEARKVGVALLERIELRRDANGKPLQR